MPSYVFVNNQGIGPNAISPSSSWAKEDIYDALQLATGPILCIFEGQDFKVAINAERALRAFAFRNAYVIVANSNEPDVRKMAQIAALYWMKKKVTKAQLFKAQNHFDTKYGRRYESAEFSCARRMLSEKCWELGSAPLLAGLHLDREALITDLKRQIRRLME